MSDAIQPVKSPHSFHMEILCSKLFTRDRGKNKRGNYLKYIEIFICIPQKPVGSWEIRLYPVAENRVCFPTHHPEALHAPDNTEAECLYSCSSQP